MAEPATKFKKLLKLLRIELLRSIRRPAGILAVVGAVGLITLKVLRHILAVAPAGHINAGVPKAGRTYFFSVGDFGVAACETAFKENQLESGGGIGHYSCSADNQKRVAAAMEHLAKGLQPKFILSLGDNFYIRGVKDSEDPQFEESFEKIYSYGHLKEIPWQITLGDHDHRGNVSALLLRPQRNPRWRLPFPYYTFELPAGNRQVRFLILDSVGLEGGMLAHTPKGRRFEQDLSEDFAGRKAGEAQWEWLSRTLAGEDESDDEASLQVVVGHRPIRSLADRGKYGSAPPEAAVAEALKAALLKASKPVVYLHGHDHVMQHFRESGQEVHHLGNGVGGMGLHPLKNCSNCSEFQWGTSAHGFAVHELAKNFLATHFVDAITQQVLHTVTIPF